ncbi:hypothetical protein GM418_30380 [Maribellus comscasis]|uniref:Uncharacterized protein n=1 Tax=Maribellus comscasis TaxID=2681766 RepID=A0A6I6K6W7_9BACT|nr:hypothetical protein GM418_30380 [Maribellus comscasis]
MSEFQLISEFDVNSNTIVIEALNLKVKEPVKKVARLTAKCFLEFMGNSFLFLRKML